MQDETPEESQRKQSIDDVKKILKQPNESELRQLRAKYLWGVVRRKKLVITMYLRLESMPDLKWILERLKNNDH